MLRAKGIIPPKEEQELTEDDIVSMVENTIQQKSQGSTFTFKACWYTMCDNNVFSPFLQRETTVLISICTK